VNNKIPYVETTVIVQGLTWFRVVMPKKLVWRSGVVRGTSLFFVRPLCSVVASAGCTWKEMVRMGCTIVVGGCGGTPILCLRGRLEHFLLWLWFLL